MKISIVIPAFNEEENIAFIYNELVGLSLGSKTELEIIFIDDGSRDRTFEMVKDLSNSDNRVRGIRFSRNFGKSTAHLAGSKEATGDLIITMDADGQHPPALIPEMIKEQEKGFDIINTIKIYSKKTAWFKRKTSSWFYKILNRFSDINLNGAQSEFRLMTKKANDAFLMVDEKSRYTNGLINWIGFRQSSLSFSVPERHAGETKFTLKKLIYQSLDAITSFSAKPLRISILIGSIVLIFDILYGVYAIFNFFFGKTTPGWTSLMFTILFLGGVQLLSIGIIGEYIGRVFRESKKRPHYFIQERC